jgi:predicted RNase H-like HicB family nuclease
MTFGLLLEVKYTLKAPFPAAGAENRQMEQTAMLTRYLDAAMRRARYEILPDDGSFYGEIPGLDGVWANAATLEACREELASALEDWVVAGLQLGDELPELDGITLARPNIV